MSLTEFASRFFVFSSSMCILLHFRPPWGPRWCEGLSELFEESAAGRESFWERNSGWFQGWSFSATMLQVRHAHAGVVFVAWVGGFRCFDGGWRFHMF